MVAEAQSNLNSMSGSRGDSGADGGLCPEGTHHWVGGKFIVPRGGGSSSFYGHTLHGRDAVNHRRGAECHEGERTSRRHSPAVSFLTYQH